MIRRESSLGLSGRVLFLLVGSPQPADSSRGLDDAYADVIRAIGRIAFDCNASVLMRPHPCYTPLLAMVSLDFRQPERTERSIPHGSPLAAKPSVILAGASERWTNQRWPYLVTAGLLDAGQELLGTRKRSAQLRRTLQAVDPAALLILGVRPSLVADARLYRRLFPKRPIVVLEVPGDSSATPSDLDPKIQTELRNFINELKQIFERLNEGESDDRDFIDTLRDPAIFFQPSSLIAEYAMEMIVSATKH